MRLRGPGTSTSSLKSLLFLPTKISFKMPVALESSLKLFLIPPFSIVSTYSGTSKCISSRNGTPSRLPPYPLKCKTILWQKRHGNRGGSGGGVTGGGGGGGEDGNGGGRVCAGGDGFGGGEVVWSV